MSDVLTGVLEVIENDISAEWTKIKAEAGAEAQAFGQQALEAWNAVKPLLLGVLPAQFAILKDLIQTGIEDIQTLSIEQIETALLNLAVKEEYAFITTLASNVLQAIIAVFKPKTA